MIKEKLKEIKEKIIILNEQRNQTQEYLNKLKFGIEAMRIRLVELPEEERNIHEKNFNEIEEQINEILKELK